MHLPKVNSMSSEIEHFLFKLRNWKENFEFKEFDTAGGDELSQIVAMQKNKDLDGLLNVWEQKLDQDCFELPHPEFCETITRAVYSIQLGMANFVFMIDSGNKLPWVFGQCEGFIDYILTNKYHYKASLSNDKPITAQIKGLTELQAKCLEFNSKRFGFLLSQTSPYHFFYDHLKFLYFLKGLEVDVVSKCLKEENAFFKTNMTEVFTDDVVLFFPAVIGNNILSQRGSSKVNIVNEEMEKAVYKDSIEGFIPPRKENALKLWYGITGQKRSWLQQIEAIENIVNCLLPHFSSVQLYIDGMTAVDGETTINYEDEEIFGKIVELLDGDCEIYSCIGQDYRNKVKICSTVDLFIANAGTGCMVPLRFCKKPGVLHSNKRLFTFPDSYPETVKIFNKKYVVDVIEEGKVRADLVSYHIPWQHIFNLTAEVINQIKGTNIKPLVVPLVEEVAKHYDEQQKDKKHKLMAFSALENRITTKHKTPDILREVALSFEHSGEIETALKIMQKALELRPTGPIIKKKVLEYQFIIESAGQKEKR